MSKDHRIRTYTGQLVNPFNLRPEDISLDDISHSLSLQARFTGHTSQHWSIAQHALLVAHICPNGYKFDGLNHDDDEYCGNDMASPVKRHISMWFYRRYEKKRQKVIAKVFGLRYPFPDEVHIADKDALHIEQYLFMNKGTFLAAGQEIVKRYDQPNIFRYHACEYAKKLSEMSMSQIEQLFIDSFYLYKKQEQGE